jgi:PIN domain nuclease of toxin-antitoxin system
VRLLLDTHVLLWWVTGDRQLTKPRRELIADPENQIAVSAASFWEIAIKKVMGRGQIEIDELYAAIKEDAFEEIPVRISQMLSLKDLPRFHADPFDRLLIAQSITEHRRLVTHDAGILVYSGVRGFDPLAI